MGLLDAMLGRTKVPKANLDDLFALPSAALSLQAAAGLASTGTGSVCFRAAQGGAFSATETEIEALLGAGGPRPEKVTDSYGFTWLVSHRDDVGELVTELHAVNSSLVDAQFGNALLCSVLGFAGSGRRLGLVYLFKRGTFYPFAPLPGEKRDNALELEVRGVLAGELRIEPELNRWFPVWGAPGV
jgi:hypothetical protein